MAKTPLHSGRTRPCADRDEAPRRRPAPEAVARQRAGRQNSLVEPRSAASRHSAPTTPRDATITQDMIARLAQRLWEIHGGNAVLNWLEAEQMLQDLMAPRAEAVSSRSQLKDSSSRDSVRLSRKLNTRADLKGAVR